MPLTGTEPVTLGPQAYALTAEPNRPNKGALLKETEVGLWVLVWPPTTRSPGMSLYPAQTPVRPLGQNLCGKAKKPGSLLLFFIF